MQAVIEAGRPLNITATNGTLKDIALMGIFVASCSSSPTIKVEDASGTIVNTFTPLAGTYYPMPCRVTGTLTVTISGTVDCTIFHAQ